MSLPDDDTGPIVSSAELHGALEHVLSDYFCTRRRITTLDRRPSVYRSSFALEELDVRLDDGTSLQLMFKSVGQRGLLAHARGVKPAFLCDPLREIEAYRTILAPAGLGTPTCYGSVVDQQAGHYWLFLERVPGLELYQVGLPIWQEVARWLAAMHARFAGETALPMRAMHLLNYNGDYYRHWLRRAQAFAQQAEPSRSGKARRGVEWLATRYDQVVEHLVALPTTFIHGEFYASNVLVQEAAGALRVCPVDWEMAAVGPGLVDLAALTAGMWTTEEKENLALAYHAALASAGGWPPAPEAFLAALDCCHLHLAVQWLGWAPEWSPPPDQAQDWLNEALRLAEKLGL
jgi:Ser/Thr protein kinase RdoA (MazF antagonist)